VSWNSYSLIIIITILINLGNIILALMLSKETEAKGGFYLIIISLIGISALQINDFLSMKALEENLLSPFELISLIGTTILFLSQLIFLITKKFEKKIPKQENAYFYSPFNSNYYQPQTSNKFQEPVKSEFKSETPSQRISTQQEPIKTQKEPVHETQTTIKVQEPKTSGIETATKTQEPKEHIKEVPTNGKAVIAKFITREEPRSEVDKIKEELNKIKFQRDKLVSIISHDLRTPLTSVFGYCQLLKDGQYKNKKEVKQFAENIFELSKQQLNALNRIIEWTKYESPTLSLNPTDFDVTSTINFVVKTMSKIAEQKNIKIIVNSKPETYVYGDEFMIIEVLKNLLDNAIKFSHPDNSIEIHTHYHEKLNKLVVLVVDSGIGIDREILMNLLVSTKKFTTRGTKGEKGLGLGLLIVKAIIDKHGEHFWIASEEGKWTRVYFTLKPSKAHN